MRPLAGVEIVQHNRALLPEANVVTVGTPAAPVVFDRPGVAVLGCNIHDDMAAWVVIVETPWFARTDAQGRARLPEVPAGRHQLRTWHSGFVVGAPALRVAVKTAD